MMASLYEMRGDAAQSASEYGRVLARDPRNTFAISGLARLALQRSVVDEAREILAAGAAAGAPTRQLRPAWAALSLVAGALPRARVLLQEVCEEPGASPMSLAMLAMVMIEQQDVGAVETKVLPRLVKDAKGQDTYFAQVIQGRVWQSKGKAGYKNARLCFQRAALIRPDVQALADVLLTLDVALEDQKSAEAHALAILRQRPDHPYANFIMGTVRLEQGQYGDAEAYLRRSVAADAPMLAALNNYAQVLCRIRRLDEAEQAARQAVAQASDRYEGWATLAFVLAEKGAPGQAAEALEKARAINGKAARLNLVEALGAVKRGEPEAAEKALARAGGEAGLSVADRRVAAGLREEIARLRRGR
jgi:predicted Zn-dependent protease